MSSQDLTAIKEVETSDPELKKPNYYQLILLNDDYTPMDFVVHLLQKFFSFSPEKSTKIMMQIHVEGKGSCGVYTKEIAETRKSQINEYAKQHKYILKSEIEKVD